MKTSKIGKRLISLLLTAVMFMTVYQIPTQAETTTQDAMEQQTRERETPKNPVHHCTGKDDGTDTTDWSYVYFGSYPQTEVAGDALTSVITGASYDANGDAWVDGIKYRRISKSDTNYDRYFGNSTYRYFKWERIKWRVLSNDGTTLFVAADKGLDCRDYNERYTSTTWENCTLRSWLNSSFYSTAFSNTEQGAVVSQTVVNEDNPKYGTEGGNNTTDKVYLLSIGEVTNPSCGFCGISGTHSENRRLKTSDYAHVRGIWISTNSNDSGNCCWWLRSPGWGTDVAAGISSLGYVDRDGYNVDTISDAVVPALHIDLFSDFWSLTDDGSSGSGGEDANENELHQFESKLPKLSGNMAKQFLAFVYNDSGYEKLDLSEDKYYQLLTGDYSSVTSVEELKQRIWAFSTFVRTSMNQQVSDAKYRVDYLSNELCSYLQEELKGMSNMDEQIVSEYSGKVNALFKEEIEDILCGTIAQNVGIIITENTLDDVKLAISSYNDIANLPNKISDYVNRIVAVIEGAMYVLNNDVKGRTMYFNCYLSNREDYGSADDDIFTTVMEYNKFAITDNTYLSNVIDFTTWITGKDSWDAHTNELNAWAEYLYQLEQCMNISQHEYTSEVIKPTCSERGYTKHQCTLCGKTYNNNYVDALGHDFSKKVISNDYLKSPATCTKATTYYYACSKCGARGTAVFEDGAALGHRFTHYTSNNDMSCESDGTKTAVCDNGCGQLSTVANTGSKLGHTLRKISAKKATCTENGNIEYWECMTCHNFYRDAEAKVQVSYNSLISGALGHGNTKIVNNGDGTHSVICTRCNMELEKKNHRGGKATCSRKKKCEVCNAEYGDFDSSVHENTEVRDKKAATCGVEGYTGDTYCKDCNAKIESGQVIVATGKHTWDEGKDIKTPTCTEKGEKEYTCTVCGETKTEEISAMEHQNTEVRNKQVATCKADGYSGDVYCKDCNAKIESGQVIAATGKHTWDEGKDIKTPTCTEKGEKEYTCTVCGETKKEELEKNPHTYETTIIKATTAKNGSITEKCTVCGDVRSNKTIFSVKSLTLKTTSYTYNGKVKKPSVTVKDSSGQAISNGNYTVAYNNNVKVGKAIVTIKLKGNYEGALTKTFTICPKGTSVSGKIAAKSRGLTVKWKKQSQSTTGYQIQISTNKKFAKKATMTKTVKKNFTTKLTVKKLKPKKKYYVRIRTYKVVKGKNYCSSWSKAKTVTTKK